MIFMRLCLFVVQFHNTRRFYLGKKKYKKEKSLSKPFLFFFLPFHCTIEGCFHPEKEQQCAFISTWDQVSI